CTLGTPDHCGACSIACPPGRDDSATLRTCSNATSAGVCDLICRGEWYDLDGDAANGCESAESVVQDSAPTALDVRLGDVVNDPSLLVNPRNLAGFIYSDRRMHETPPYARPTGRDDWYLVDAIGTGDPSIGMTACLGITSFPMETWFEICIADAG